jgi:hypothetical protein
MIGEGLLWVAISTRRRNTFTVEMYDPELAVAEV